MKMMQIKMTPLGPKSGGARAPPAPPVPTALLLDDSEVATAVNLSYVAPAKPSLRVTCVAWFLSRLIDLTDGDDSLGELGLDLVLTSITGTAVDLQVGDFHMWHQWQAETETGWDRV